ncbi:MAG TPA: VOC family protein [Rubricoccaceae bacterium]|nr:VOC family protein [Rubricoccaceae bacterium]
MMPPAHDPALPVGLAPPGYRLPDATRLGRVRLQVADLARSLDFYEGVLSFRVLDRAGGTAALGADAPLVELVEKPGVRPVPRRGLLGLFHVAYLLPERAALGRFVRHVAEAGVPVGMSDHLVSEAVYLTDPDGLGIEVYADRPRAAWRRDGRQIAMATNPLDVRSLIEAAGDAPWTGAPAGTVVGHVHLHVGDLGRAAGFYHAALGLDKVVWDYPGALFLSAGGYHHHLGLNTWATGAPPAGEDDAQLLEWTVVVPTAEDAEAAERSVEAAGYPVARDERGWRAEDPWGTPLRVVPTA